MEKIQLFNQDEHANLHIVEYMNLSNLPEPLRQMLALASTPEEQDILLMATLTAASACLPNLFFRYGPTGKMYFANLQCFILAASAGGKGIANQALEMVRVVDEHKVLFIEAKAQGISTRTATRWNDNWQEQGLVLRLKHGVYRKVG